MTERTWTIYVCDATCGYVSMTPGKCRSHPYPLRAMGPDLRPITVGDLQSQVVLVGEPDFDAETNCNDQLALGLMSNGGRWSCSICRSPDCIAWVERYIEKRGATFALCANCLWTRLSDFALVVPASEAQRVRYLGLHPE